MSDHVVHIHDVEIRAGTQIQDRYEITRHLGTGGFAQVFEAFDTNIERPVAIKFLNLHASSTDQDATDNILARFKREAKLAAKIQHANVVNIFDFGVVGQNKNIPFIVMELLSGFDFEEQVYERGAMKAERALPLFVGCLEALGEAHKLSIVHKDLKPSNLFLSNPGQRSEALRIVDFGIAHIRDAREGRLTATGEILGTPQYLPPEYIEAQIVTPAYDIYQMGLILVETLTGKPVVDEVHPLRCVKSHSMGELDLPTSLLESSLGPVIAKALHIDHTARFKNAEEFADALAEIDPGSLPVFGPDMPLSRLAQAGTLDSDSRIMNSSTGHMRQPSTGQLNTNGNTNPGYAQSHHGQSPNGVTSDIASQPTGQHAHVNQSTTADVSGSTERAIQNAGFGKGGLKALLVLGVAVIALGGIAAWLLVAQIDNGPGEPGTVEPGPNDQAATAEANPAEEMAGSEVDAPTTPKYLADHPTKPQKAAVVGTALVDGDGKATEDVAPAAAAKPIDISVDSSPGGAIVYRGSEKLGTSPVSLTFESDQDEPVELRLARRGYKSKRVTVDASQAPSLVVDLDRKPRPRPEPVKKQPAKTRPAPKKPVVKSNDPPEQEKKPEKEEKKEAQRMLIAP
jgi:serine/threonine-protein kinase